MAAVPVKRGRWKVDGIGEAPVVPGFDRDFPFALFGNSPAYSKSYNTKIPLRLQQSSGHPSELSRQERQGSWGGSQGQRAVEKPQNLHIAVASTCICRTGMRNMNSPKHDWLTFSTAPQSISPNGSLFHVTCALF